MVAIIQWASANWKNVALAVLAIDAALIPLFPKAGILLKIKDFISGIAPKA